MLVTATTAYAFKMKSILINSYIKPVCMNKAIRFSIKADYPIPAFVLTVKIKMIEE